MLRAGKKHRSIFLNKSQAVQRHAERWSNCRGRSSPMIGQKMGNIFCLKTKIKKPNMTSGIFQRLETGNRVLISGVNLMRRMDVFHRMENGSLMDRMKSDDRKFMFGA